MPVVLPSSCRAQSKALGVPLGGTAVASTTVWIVLEHCGAWPAKAVPDGGLPEAVKAQLAALPTRIPGARVQLVRRPGARTPGRKFWIGLSDLGREQTCRWILDSEADLVSLDIPELVAAMRRGETPPGAERVTEPMVLVCTNGRRDVCCSIEGVPVARALAQHEGVDVWHTTHLGGHRFAATLLHLPAGLCYGWVEAQHTRELAAAVVGGEVFSLDCLRGRTALTKPEQAAETAWRRQVGVRSIDALAAARHEIEDDHVRVTLRDRQGAEHCYVVRQRSLGGSVRPSCGKEPEPAMAWLAEPAP